MFLQPRLMTCSDRAEWRWFKAGHYFASIKQPPLASALTVATSATQAIAVSPVAGTSAAIGSTRSSNKTVAADSSCRSRWKLQTAV